MPRVPPEEAYQKVKSGKAILVCAYTDEDRCSTMHLGGAIFLKEFESKLPSLSKNQEIIFYCA
ncbi:ArsR family transcriptional regulator [Candidatus Poribacteria bacterium]|nr:ArsR family transcriptional regulator [Candidatus Poribacteria bacterium]